MTDPLRAKAEAIANDLFWIIDDKAVQIIHKHLLEMEEERTTADSVTDSIRRTVSKVLDMNKRLWTCIDCGESFRNVSWKTLHDHGWRKLKSDETDYVICNVCRKRNEIDEENAS